MTWLAALSACYFLWLPCRPLYDVQDSTHWLPPWVPLLLPAILNLFIMFNFLSSCCQDPSLLLNGSRSVYHRKSIFRVSIYIIIFLFLWTCRVHVRAVNSAFWAEVPGGKALASTISWYDTLFFIGHIPWSCSHYDMPRARFPRVWSAWSSQLEQTR